MHDYRCAWKGCNKTEQKKWCPDYRRMNTATETCWLNQQVRCSERLPDAAISPDGSDELPRRLLPHLSLSKRDRARLSAGSRPAVAAATERKKNDGGLGWLLRCVTCAPRGLTAAFSGSTIIRRHLRRSRTIRGRGGRETAHGGSMSSRRGSE